MKERPFVILDDFFVGNDLFSKLDETDVEICTIGSHFEVKRGQPFLTKLFSSGHMLPRSWTRTNDTQITYSRWLICAHLTIIAIIAFKFMTGITSAPLLYSLGTLSNICLMIILMYHALLFCTFNFKRSWFEPVVLFISPLSWAAVWLLLIYKKKAEDFLPPCEECLQLNPGRATPGLTFLSTVDQRVDGVALLGMQLFIWYTRRTLIGIVVFERKIRASRLAYWCYRVYTMAAAPVIVALFWKWYPYLTVCWDLHEYLAPAHMVDQRFMMEWLSMRTVDSPLLFAVATAVAGTTHVFWHSFISYAYHMVVWKEYLRDGLAVWVIGDSAMCTKVY